MDKPQFIGKVILNKYRVDSFIAAGGMSSIYKVWDIQRSVALAMKVLNIDFEEDPSALKRFRREASAYQKLAHPNIVQFFGLETFDDKVIFLQRYIDGPTLKEILVATRGPLPLSEVLVYLRAICSALGYAHNNGIVHCDVKPNNILIDRGGNIYLSDFGIARRAESTTSTAASAGTPAYMAPEQIREESVSPATDIYALGVILFEMLTGQRPFKIGNINRSTGIVIEDLRMAHLVQPPPDPRKINPNISPELSLVILRAMSKDPSERFSTASELFKAVCSACGIDPATVSDRASNEYMPILAMPNIQSSFKNKSDNQQHSKRRTFSRPSLALLILSLLIVATSLLLPLSKMPLVPFSEYKTLTALAQNTPTVSATPPTATFTNTPTPTTTPVANSSITPSKLPFIERFGQPPYVILLVLIISLGTITALTFIGLKNRHKIFILFTAAGRLPLSNEKSRKDSVIKTKISNTLDTPEALRIPEKEKYEVIIQVKPNTVPSLKNFHVQLLNETISRKNEQLKMMKFLQEQEGGMMLVSGYQGVGKSSFVRNVISNFKKAAENSEENELTTKVVEIFLDISAMDVSNIIHLIIKKLYDRLEELHILEDFPKPLKDRIDLANSRISGRVEKDSTQGHSKSAEAGAELYGQKVSGKAEQSSSSSQKIIFDTNYDKIMAEHDLITILTRIENQIFKRKGTIFSRRGLKNSYRILITGHF